VHKVISNNSGITNKLTYYIFVLTRFTADSQEHSPTAEHFSLIWCCGNASMHAL